MSKRMLPSDNPVAEQVLEWTIKRNSKDIAQLMKWMGDATSRKDRRTFINRTLDLMEELQHAQNLLDGNEVKNIRSLLLAGGRSSRMQADKALIEVGGVPMICIITRELAKAGKEPIRIAISSQKRLMNMVKLLMMI